MAIATINPATGETLRVFEPLSTAKVEEKLQRAADTFREYRRTTFAQISTHTHPTACRAACAHAPNTRRPLDGIRL